MEKIQKTRKTGIEKILRAEKLNIIPYARSASHAFKINDMQMKTWDNGWDNCCPEPSWVNAPHPWNNQPCNTINIRTEIPNKLESALDQSTTEEWSNSAWDNWGDWVNSNNSDKKASFLLWSDFENITKHGQPVKFGDAILLRNDGFIYNKLNEVIFKADEKAMNAIKQLLNVPAKDIAIVNSEILDKLWLV